MIGFLDSYNRPTKEEYEIDMYGTPIGTVKPINYHSLQLHFNYI